MSATGPNIALIVLDTARADAFEPYGARPGSSPVFADLARRGAALEAMYAASCWTLPSHVSLFSGLLPRAAGISASLVRARGPFEPVVRSLRGRLLPEVLRRAGYATTAVSTNPWIARWHGFDTGFEEFVYLPGQRHRTMRQGAGPRATARWMLSGLRAREDDGAGAATDHVGRLLGSGGRPFFMFVNLMECHSPYLPPKPYNPLGPIGRMRAASEARRYLATQSIWKAAMGALDVPDAALERIRRLYAGAIRQLDDWLARFLDILERIGTLEDTLLIVTSDHGENLGEGGRMGHICSLDDRLLRVPCAVCGPGAFAPAGTQSLAALPRLIAEAIGLDEHPWTDGPPGDGVALAQFDSRYGAEDEILVQARSRFGVGSEAIARITTSLSCATDGRHKLLLRGSEELLYDLASDPLEESPLPAGELGEAVVGPLRAALSDRAAGAGDTRPPVSVAQGEATTMSEQERQELEERMRLLGYM